MQNDEMFALRMILQRLRHLLKQQHIVDVFTAVAGLGANLLTVRDVIRQRIGVEPHLTLHSEEIGAKTKLLQHSKHVLLFQRALWVITRTAFTHKHTAQ